MGSILKEMYGLKLSLPEIALIGQYSENNYNGMNCGIMDQFASTDTVRNWTFADGQTLTTPELYEAAGMLGMAQQHYAAMVQAMASFGAPAAAVSDTAAAAPAAPLNPQLAAGVLP